MLSIVIILYKWIGKQKRQTHSQYEIGEEGEHLNFLHTNKK